MIFLAWWVLPPLTMIFSGLTVWVTCYSQCPTVQFPLLEVDLWLCLDILHVRTQTGSNGFPKNRAQIIIKIDERKFFPVTIWSPNIALRHGPFVDDYSILSWWFFIAVLLCWISRGHIETHLIFMESQPGFGSRLGSFACAWARRQCCFSAEYPIPYPRWWNDKVKRAIILPTNQGSIISYHGQANGNFNDSMLNIGEKTYVLYIQLVHFRWT